MADLAGLAKRAAEAGIFCDFDGALAPIVPDPEMAKPLPGATRVLGALAKRFKVVAVVTGRSALDLSSRLKVPGIRMVGLHGSEEIRGDGVWIEPAAAAAVERVQAAADELRVALRGVRGVILEHKGLALAVHFRRAPNPDEAERLAAPIVGQVASDHALLVVPGRRILELRPPGAGDKGDAVRRLIADNDLRAGLFAGDDVGDLPAFAALDALDVAVRIAVASEESPPELSAVADLVVGSPAELLDILRRLAS